MCAGNIRTYIFQELLIADLVVADLSIDNLNVWYELGLRHALRKRGVVQITCRRDQTPFDVLTERLEQAMVLGGGKSGKRAFLPRSKPKKLAIGRRWGRRRSRLEHGTFSTSDVTAGR
jgi:hypothetical protein